MLRCGHRWLVSISGACKSINRWTSYSSYTWQLATIYGPAVGHLTSAKSTIIITITMGHSKNKNKKNPDLHCFRCVVKRCVNHIYLYLFMVTECPCSALPNKIKRLATKKVNGFYAEPYISCPDDWYHPIQLWLYTLCHLLGGLRSGGQRFMAHRLGPANGC